MAVNSTAIVNVTQALRGAGGSVEIKGVRRLAHRTTGMARTLAGAKMPAEHRNTYASVVLALQTVEDSEYISHQVADLDEILTVKYVSFGGNRTRTYFRVRAMIGGESLFPPPEEDGPAAVREIQFVLLEKLPGDGLSTAWSDVAG